MIGFKKLSQIGNFRFPTYHLNIRPVNLRDCIPPSIIGIRRCCTFHGLGHIAGTQIKKNAFYSFLVLKMLSIHSCIFLPDHELLIY